MLELVFGEGPAGALKCTKSSSLGEVMPLTLALDIGDISGMDAGLKERRAVLEDLFGDYPGVPDSIWSQNLRTLARLDEAKKTGEPVRAWYSPYDPGELCAFCFLCHVLWAGKAPLLAVAIPNEFETEGVVLIIRSSGELEPERLGSLAERAKPVSQTRLNAYANIWRGLAEENAPLRAVVNGKLLSVPRDYYDFALRRNIPDGEFVAARLVGRTLCELPGVGDRWLFLRMKKMLESEELVEVRPANADHPYSAILRKTPR